MSGFAKLRAFLRILGARYTEDTQPNKPVCTRLAVCRGGTQQASYSELYMYYTSSTSIYTPLLFGDSRV